VDLVLAHTVVRLSSNSQGALLQSANPRLGRGRIRNRTYEILYLAAAGEGVRFTVASTSSEESLFSTRAAIDGSEGG